MLLWSQREPARRRGVVEVLRVETGADGVPRALAADTLLYPEGGGQPADHGTLGGVAVRGLVRGAEGVVHLLDAPIPAGPAEVVVDWPRRWDHTQQHTAQHLLTAVAQDAFGWATTSFHLHPGLGAACDVELDAEVPAAALPDLEARVNERIRAALPVTVSTCAPDELAARGVRTRGLPDGHTGPVRLVTIEGVDVNTCGGTHAANTAELQVVALLGAERIRGGTRVSFVAGDRARAWLHEALDRVGSASAALSRPPAELAEGVARLLAEQKALTKRADALADELAELHAAALVAQGGLRCLHRAPGDAAWANRVVAKVLSSAPDARVLVTTGPDDDGQFVLAGPPEWVATVKSQVLAALGARGGGPPGRLQGKATALGGREALARTLG